MDWALTGLISSPEFVIQWIGQNKKKLVEGTVNIHSESPFVVGSLEQSSTIRIVFVSNTGLNDN